MFGYFKVTNKFFELNSFSPIDTKFISDKYQLSTFDSNVTFTSRTIQRYKQLIKTHLGINEYNNDIESKLQQYAIELANNFPSNASPWKGKFIIQAKHTTNMLASCSDSEFNTLLKKELESVRAQHIKAAAAAAQSASHVTAPAPVIEPVSVLNDTPKSLH